jgi:predicted enzyme related to lactoylglutathione lyase
MARPVHFEIHAESVERAIAFYTKLFGWEFTQWGTQPYWLIKTGEPPERGIDGGLLPRRGPGPVEMAAVNAYVCTIGVADLDATVKALTDAGGRVALPRMPIPTVGWLAYGKDTEGNLFGMMQMDANAA